MRKSLLIGLTLISLGAFSFNAPAGIFIADEENRWHIPGTDKASEEKLGYVICEGGYLGSPLIPNEKKIVDEFLQNCASPLKKGPSKLPIIDVEANHTKSAGYKAYSIPLRGRTYHLCHGFLNSSNWCSFSAEKQAMDFVSKIRRGDNIQSTAQINPPTENFLPTTQNTQDPHPPRQALIQEITQEISQTLNLPNLASANQNKQAIQITKDEMVALKEGKISLEQLTNSRPTLSLNANNQPILPSGNPNKQAIQITKDEMVALKEGKINLEQLTNSRPTLSLNANNQPILPSAQENFNGLSQNIPIAGGQIQTRALSLGNPNAISTINPNALPAQIQQLLANQGLMTAPVNNPQSSSIQQIDPAQLASFMAGQNSYMPQVQANSPNKQAIQITKDEMVALKEGRISLEQLTNSRPTLSLNANNQPILPSAQENFNGLSQNIPIAGGQIQTRALSLGNPNAISTMTAQTINANALPAQIQQLLANQGLMAVPVGNPQSSPIQQIDPAQLNSFMPSQNSYMPQVQANFQTIPLQPQLVYQNPQPQNYYYPQPSYVPTTQAYSTIYGTHTNTVYWPSGAGRSWY